MNVVENKYHCNLPLLFHLKIILGTTHERNRCENVIRDVYPYNTCTGKVILSQMTLRSETESKIICFLSQGWVMQMHRRPQNTLHKECEK